MTVSAKACAKLLAFLRDGGARVEPMQGAPTSAGLMLVRDDGTRHLSACVDDCRSDGLVKGTDRVEITQAGAAWLARHASRHADQPFARQHQRRESASIEIDGHRETVTVDRNHSPLSRLAHAKGRDGRPWLDPDGLEAGERLARDFEIGALRQRVTSSWDPTPRGAKGAGTQADLGDAAIDARSRLERALSHLGPDLAGVALDICCFAKGTSQVESERRWPPRSAKLMLRTALDLLARHYGLRTGEGTARNRAWRAA